MFKPELNPKQNDNNKITSFIFIPLLIDAEANIVNWIGQLLSDFALILSLCCALQ